MAYGVDFSRFREPKRATDDLDLGPLVETHMTRCISCTRCVRFTTEVAGITRWAKPVAAKMPKSQSYLGETLGLQPAGQHHRFVSRWRLGVETLCLYRAPVGVDQNRIIDVMDALGSNIRVDTKGREVMRFLPLQP